MIISCTPLRISFAGVRHDDYVTMMNEEEEEGII